MSIIQQLTQRDKNIIRFFKANRLVTLNTSEQEPQAEFSSKGCDVCGDGLGNNVYPCHGLTAKNNIVTGFEVCHACLSTIVNGE